MTESMVDQSQRPAPSGRWRSMTTVSSESNVPSFCSPPRSLKLSVWSAWQGSTPFSTLVGFRVSSVHGFVSPYVRVTVSPGATEIQVWLVVSQSRARSHAASPCAFRSAPR